MNETIKKIIHNNLENTKKIFIEELQYVYCVAYFHISLMYKLSRVLTQDIIVLFYDIK